MEDFEKKQLMIKEIMDKYEDNNDEKIIAESGFVGLGNVFNSMNF